MSIRKLDPDLEARVAVLAAALLTALRDAWRDPATGELGTPSDPAVAQLFYDATRDTPTRTFHVQLARILECASRDGCAPAASRGVARLVDALFGADDQGGPDVPPPVADVIALSAEETEAQAALDRAQWRFVLDPGPAALIDMQQCGERQADTTRRLVNAAYRTNVGLGLDRARSRRQLFGDGGQMRRSA